MPCTEEISAGAGRTFDAVGRMAVEVRTASVTVPRARVPTTGSWLSRFDAKRATGSRESRSPAVRAGWSVVCRR